MLVVFVYQVIFDNRLIPATLLCLSQDRTWISNAICRGLSCVDWFAVTGGCSLCYWVIYWSSVFKLFFLNRMSLLADYIWNVGSICWLCSILLHRARLYDRLYLVSRLYCLGMLCLAGKTSIVFIHFDNQHTKHERTNKQFMYMYSVVNHADNFHNLVFIRKHINAI